MRTLPFDHAVRNLGRSPFRLAAGTAGSALVVLLVLSAAAFVRGMGASIEGSGGRGNVLLIGNGSEDSIERSEVPPVTAGVAAASIPGIRRRLGVPFVSPEIHAPLSVDLGDGGGERFANFRGIVPEAFLVHSRARLTGGRLPGPGEVIVGRLAAARMGVPPERLAAGAALRIEGRSWTVAGAFEAPGTVMESEIWMPLSDLYVATRRERPSCVVVTMDGDDLSEADLFARQRLDLEITAVPEEEYYHRIHAFYGPVRAMVWVTAILVAAGAFLGGLNTLYAAFASRVREMATLQVLGFPRRAVALNLLQESALLSAAGSLLAAGIAVLFLDGLSVRISMGAFGLRVDGVALATGLLTGVGLGLLGALIPAARCLRIPIPEALRSV